MAADTLLASAGAVGYNKYPKGSFMIWGLIENRWVNMMGGDIGY